MDDVLQYRKAADRVWEMAKEYESKGFSELASTMKDLAVQLHDLAREKTGNSIPVDSNSGEK